MLKFITVWVLTVTYLNDGQSAIYTNTHTYQLQYATQSICEKQRAKHTGRNKTSRCDFQQVPVYVGSQP